MPQQFGNDKTLTEWRRTAIPTFGDGKLIAGWLFFRHEITFGCGNNVAFLALSVNFLQLIFGWG
jgi:hypothetical protein